MSTTKTVRGGKIDLTESPFGLEVTEGPDDVCVFLLDGAGRETDEFCFHPADATALALLLLPPGTVAVDRARVERLIEYVDASHAFWDKEPWSDQWLSRASDALQPGDRDPLPEEEP